MISGLNKERTLLNFIACQTLPEILTVLFFLTKPSEICNATTKLVKARNSENNSILVIFGLLYHIG